MKGFKKLALVTAVAALPMAGFAMEAMDDAALSGVTGQDGIALAISLNNTLNLGIEDTDGLGTGSFAEDPGLIMIVGMSMNGTANIAIDAGTTVADGSVLQVAINIPTLTLNTGDIHVGAGTDGTDAAAGLANFGTELAAVGTPILESVGITLTGVDLTLQLGAGAQNLFALGTAAPVNIQIGDLANTADNFQLNDIPGGGALIVGEININNVDLNGITGSITTAGLEISTNAALSGISVAMMDVKLGTAASPSIGNVYITGLNLSGQTITISGK
jgi:hypothetical protein